MPSSLRRPLLSAALCALTVLAVPAGASAITATLSAPCYTHVPTVGSQPVVVSLTGGSPGAGFVLAATVPGKGEGSAGSTEGTFDATGNAVAQIADVAPPSGIGPTRGQRIGLSITEYPPGAPTISAPLGSTLITNYSIDVRDKPIKPSARRLVRVSGTPFAGRPLYGFIVAARGGRVLRRFSLGRADVCGFAAKKAIVGPPGYRPGSYRLYVNAGRKLDKHTAIYVGFRIYRHSL